MATWNRKSQSSEMPETGGISGKPPVKIVDPGGSWRRFFCVIFTVGPLIAVFLFVAQNDRVFGFNGGLSPSLTKSPHFLLLQGKEMMLFPAPTFVFLDSCCPVSSRY
jgi:hypothetical protein